MGPELLAGMSALFFSGIASISWQGWLLIAAGEVGNVRELNCDRSSDSRIKPTRNYCFPIDIKYLIV